MTDDDEASSQVHNLVWSRPQWTQKMIERLSLRKAIALLQAARIERRLEAKSAARAIEVIQKYPKAKRDFIIMMIYCPVIALMFVYGGEPIAGALWICNAPILLLHLRKANAANERAQNRLRLGTDLDSLSPPSLNKPTINR